MSDFFYQKQIRILDEEKEMFEALWQAYIHDKKKEKDFEMFVEFLSTQYGFQQDNFTLYDKDGKFFHRRVPRNNKTEKLE